MTNQDSNFIERPGVLALVSSLIIIAIFVSGLFAPKGWNWALVMLFMIVFIALIGWLITGRFSGIFINERNKMTLSRFQLVIWTVIVLSAFLAIALERVKAGALDPLAIALPTQLWALLGISTASLVGSPLILSTKVQKTPTQPAKETAEKLLVRARALNNPEIRNTLAAEEKIKADDKKLGARALTTEESNARDKNTAAVLKIKADAKEDIKKNADANGILDSNKNFGDANFSEMFTGDEMDNKGLIDMAKVQMFFFTLIIAFSYMVLLVNLIMTVEPAGLNSFPALSDGLVALLGISSGGYLTNKAVDHTKTE
jgi:hypothetical protein